MGILLSLSALFISNMACPYSHVAAPADPPLHIHPSKHWLLSHLTFRYQAPAHTLEPSVFGVAARPIPSSLHTFASHSELVEIIMLKALAL